MEAMSRDRMIEADWKILRQLHPIALERFCQRVLSEVGRIASDAEKGAHSRYLEAYDLIRHRHKEMANAFDDLRRSTGLMRLAWIRSFGLLTEEEFASFSPETRQVVQSLTTPLDD